MTMVHFSVTQVGLEDQLLGKLILKVLCVSIPCSLTLARADFNITGTTGVGLHPLSIKLTSHVLRRHPTVLELVFVMLCMLWIMHKGISWWTFRTWYSRTQPDKQACLWERNLCIGDKAACTKEVLNTKVIECTELNTKLWLNLWEMTELEEQRQLLAKEVQSYRSKILQLGEDLLFRLSDSQVTVLGNIYFFLPQCNSEILCFACSRLRCHSLR